MSSINKIVYKTIAAVLPALMLFSCSGYGDETLPKETEKTEVVQAAVPSVGVGRDFPEETTIPVSDNAPVICIDPGHGFDDSGCSSDYLGGLYEDDINLAISLLLDVEDEDSSVLKTFAIGEYMDKSGYDWTEADLEDVVIVLDYSVTGLRVVFKGWDKEYTYDIIL